jgi:hypothetical protein
MYQELNKQGMQKGTHDGHSHHSTKTDNHNPSHKKIEIIHQQQVKRCHEQHKHHFGHLRELRPMNILIDCPRVKQKSAFQKTRRKQL